MKKLLLLTTLMCQFIFSMDSAELMEDFFDKSLINTQLADLSIDMYQDDDNVIVKMKAPSIDPEKIDIDIKDKTLRVCGKQKELKEVSKEGYYQKHASSSSFNRVISLPCLVDSQLTTAKIRDGILTITMPKIKDEE